MEGIRCGVRCGPVGREAVGDCGARSVQARDRVLIRGRTGVERTQNMPYMVVTLEVSTLSGWLNADAYCRESNGGHTVRGEGAGLEAGGRRATAGQAGCRAGLDCRLGAGHGAERT